MVNQKPIFDCMQLCLQFILETKGIKSPLISSNNFFFYFNNSSEIFTDNIQLNYDDKKYIINDSLWIRLQEQDVSAFNMIDAPLIIKCDIRKCHWVNRFHNMIFHLFLVTNFDEHFYRVIDPYFNQKLLVKKSDLFKIAGSQTEIEYHHLDMQNMGCVLLESWVFYRDHFSDSIKMFLSALKHNLIEVFQRNDLNTMAEEPLIRKVGLLSNYRLQYKRMLEVLQNDIKRDSTDIIQDLDYLHQRWKRVYLLITKSLIRNGTEGNENENNTIAFYFESTFEEEYKVLGKLITLYEGIL